MNLRLTLLPALLVSGFLAVSFADEPMMMKTPTDAAELTAVGLTKDACVTKANLSAKWLKAKLHIKDETIITEILESNKLWPDSCACPYNLDNGKKTVSRCGARSHYTKTNSLNLKCYPKDVLDQRSVATTH